MTYYDVKERVLNWFYKLNIEDQRNELIRTIKSCKVFSHYLFIEAGTVVFFFDISKKYEFEEYLLETLKKDGKYKAHFVENTDKMRVRRFNHFTILKFDLNKGDRRILIFQYLIKNMNIVYDLTRFTHFISLERLKGLLSQTPITEQFENIENQ